MRTKRWIIGLLILTVAVIGLAGLIYTAGLPMRPESLLKLREVDGPVLDWFREVFWLLPVIAVFDTFIPIVLGGLLIGGIMPQMPDKRSCYMALAGVILFEGIACCLSFWVKGAGLEDACELVLLPVSWQSPYINISAMLFFWLPVLAQAAIGLRISRQRAPLGPLITSCAGVLAIAVGILFLLGGNILVGAPVD